MRTNVRLAVTGDVRFAKRHKLLFEAIATKCARVDYVTSDARTPLQRLHLCLTELAFIAGVILKRKAHIPRKLDDVRLLRRRFILSGASFKLKSVCTQQNLRHLECPPQVVLHIFGLYRPFWKQSPTPFVQYLDYTTALARRNWPPNLPQLSDVDFSRWMALERTTYHAAAHLFPMSRIAAKSLVEDYGVPSERVTAIGSGGRYREPYAGVKSFGSKKILFNANPFGRKGGDIVLGAFEIVRLQVPDATLIVIGLTLGSPIPGVYNPGFVADPEELQRLFLDCDLVVAPARADPFPGFVIEAMSHGVPCIVSAVDGMPEIVDHGVNGLVLEAPAAEDLSRAVLEMLGNTAMLKEFSRAALCKARDRFAWSAIAEPIVARLATITGSQVHAEGGSVCECVSCVGSSVTRFAPVEPLL